MKNIHTKKTNEREKARKKPKEQNKPKNEDFTLTLCCGRKITFLKF